jgi:UDP-N-acetylglucosamine 1-carboxyvinyltransferase
MLDLLCDLGADAAWTGANEVRVDARGTSKSAPDERLCSMMRASFLLAGPLLSRFGRATMPPPGGDVIGRRRLDPHMHALSELGAEIDLSGRLYELQATRLQGANLFLDEASVMATENTVMAAVLARGETVLGNAACEPHVQDLCRFLVSAGAQIEGIESNVLRISGVERLEGGSWSIGPDHIEVGSFIGMAAITGGDITIEGVRRQDLVSIVRRSRSSACGSDQRHVCSRLSNAADH